MAFALDATVGGTSANSYVTLVEATAILEEYITFGHFSGLADDGTKELYLVHAARLIDRLHFKGSKYETAQAMQFPRDIQPYIDTETAVTAIPPNVQKAQCEMAIHLIRHGVSKRDELRAAGVKKFSMSHSGLSEDLDIGVEIEIAPVGRELLRPYLHTTAVIV